MDPADKEPSIQHSEIPCAICIIFSPPTLSLSRGICRCQLKWPLGWCRCPLIDSCSPDPCDSGPGNKFILEYQVNVGWTMDKSASRRAACEIGGIFPGSRSRGLLHHWRIDGWDGPAVFVFLHFAAPRGGLYLCCSCGGDTEAVWQGHPSVPWPLKQSRNSNGWRILTTQKDSILLGLPIFFQQTIVQWFFSLVSVKTIVKSSTSQIITLWKFLFSATTQSYCTIFNYSFSHALEHQILCQWGYLEHLGNGDRRHRRSWQKSLKLVIHATECIQGRLFQRRAL